MTQNHDENSRECPEMRASHRMTRGMGKRIKPAKNAISAARSDPSEPSPKEVENIVEFIRDVIDRSIAYSWPPITRALAEGRQVRLTHRGKRIYLQHRSQYRPPVDYRAVEIEAIKNKELFLRQPDPDTKPEKEGYTIAEFAIILGVDRGALAKSLVEIPTGPAPVLPEGKIPCRRIGNTKRIFKQDLFGSPEQRQEPRSQDGRDTQNAATGADDEGDWRRSVNNLRLAGPARR